MSLPQRLPLPMMQTTWASQIDPVLQFAPNQGLLLLNVPLVVGSNVINHRLSRQQQGWIITDQTAAASIYRSQPFNSLTLTLVTDAITNVNLWVY